MFQATLYARNGETARYPLHEKYKFTIDDPATILGYKIYLDGEEVWREDFNYGFHCKIGDTIQLDLRRVTGVICQPGELNLNVSFSIFEKVTDWKKYGF